MGRCENGVHAEVTVHHIARLRFTQHTVGHFEIGL